MIGPATPRGRASIPCARSIPTRSRSPPASMARNLGAPAAGRRADPAEGQHRHRRQQHTTAGSLALAGARARDDATVAKRLRDAGAVILGKANLTEFANMLAVDMPSGYSSLGGQVRNPYAPALLDERGIPGRAAGRVELGLRRRRRGRTVRRGDRHRDLGLAAHPRDAERSGHREAHRRADQPRRHPADLAQPGHRGADDAHRARCRDAAERAGGARSARSGDAAAAAAGGLHRATSTGTG